MDRERDAGGHRSARSRSVSSAGREERARLRRHLDDLERELVVAQAALAEAQAQLVVARDREERELAAARRIQVSLMPRSFPDVPEGWQVGARYRPARVVGGDMYDVYGSHPRRARVLGLAIADVTGKGVTAALLMAFCRAVMRSAAWNGDGPADTLERVNRVLARDVRSGLFVTALVAELDPANRRVRWASAGHEPPLLLRPRGSITELAAGGTMLGMFADAAVQEHVRVVRSGETFVLATDGIADASDARGRRFGDARFRRALRAGAREGVEALLDGVVTAVDAFAAGVPQADDLTLLALRSRD
jgi:phosphoserine phosphatase RsbU/P